MKKIQLSIIMMIITGSQLAAQSITHATIGSSSGRLYGGNLMINYTIGESFVIKQTIESIRLENGFWAVVPATYIPLATVVYRFNGNGNFSIAENWEGGVVPPNPLPVNAEIIINHSANGQCILDMSYQLSAGSKLSLLTGKKFIIPGNLILQ